MDGKTIKYPMRGEANAAYIVRAVNSRDDLIGALERMTQAFKPFTSKPIGAPNSTARQEQDEQRDAHRHAMETIAKAKAVSA